MSANSRYEGRIGRLRYLGLMIGAAVLGAVIAALWGAFFMSDMKEGQGLASLIIVVILQSIPIVRRFHDLDRSGAHYWLLLIPVYNIYLGLLLLFKKGTVGPNRFGADPLESYDAGSEQEEEAPSGAVVTSSTPENPTPRDLYRSLLAELPPGTGRVATFQVGTGEEVEAWVQVTRGEGASINFHYPFDGEPSETLRAKGVTLPEGAALSSFETQTSAEYALPAIDVEGLVDCVETIFTRVLGVPGDRPVSGWIE